MRCSAVTCPPMSRGAPWVPRRGRIICLASNERSSSEPQAEGVEMMVEHRLRVVIPEDHRVVVEIPEDVPTGPAELILLIERPGGDEARKVAVSASAKARFESLADELAAARAFLDLSPEVRKAHPSRGGGIGRDLL